MKQIHYSTTEGQGKDSIAQESEDHVERMPEALQSRGQWHDLFWKGKGEEHEDEGNRGEEGTQDLDLKFHIGNQEHANNHPGKEGEGFVEVSHRGIACFYISRQKGYSMGGETG